MTTLRCIIPEVLGATLERSLQNLGIDYTINSFNYDRISYFASRLLRSNRIVMLALQRSFNRQLDRILRNTDNFELILLISGFKISKDNLRQIRDRKSRVVVWYTDSKDRFPNASCDLDVVSKILYHDGGDFERSQHQSKEWIPYGFDHQLYNGTTREKDIDILLTGNLKLPNYQTRLAYLKAVIESDLPTRYKIKAAVTTTDPALIDQIEGAGIQYLGRQSEQKYAELISRSKLVINVFQDDGDKPVNPLFFAIAYAKIIQICGTRPYVERWLKSGTHYISCGVDQLIPQIEAVLEGKVILNLDEARRIASNFSQLAVLERIVNGQV